MIMLAVLDFNLRKVEAASKVKELKVHKAEEFLVHNIMSLLPT